MIDTTKKLTGFNVDGTSMQVGDLATKTITANGTYNAQSVDSVDGYSEVTVNVPATQPNLGTETFNDNGTFTASDYGYDGFDEVTVDVMPNTSSITITENGTYYASDENYDGYDTIEVSVSGGGGSTPTLVTKTITQNGTYNASSDSADGYSSVTVNVSGGGSSGATLKNYLDLKGNADKLFESDVNTSDITTSDLQNLLSFSDTENCTSFNNTFYNRAGLTTIPLIDTSSATSMNYTFANCNNLTGLPQGLDTSSVETMDGIFYNCTSLVTAPDIDAGMVTSLANAFQNCTSLTSFPNTAWMTGGVTNWSYTFSGCSSLTSLPNWEFGGDSFNSFATNSGLTSVTDIDFPMAYDVAWMFGQCHDLATFTGNTFDFGSAELSYMFYECDSLATVEFDFTGVRSTDQMFYGCTALTNLTISNLYVDLDISASTLYSSATLSSIIADLGDVATDGNELGEYTATLTMGATNLAKLSQSDIDSATAKGWTLA